MSYLKRLAFHDAMLRILNDSPYPVAVFTRDNAVILSNTAYKTTKPTDVPIETTAFNDLTVCVWEAIQP